VNIQKFNSLCSNTGDYDQLIKLQVVEGRKLLHSTSKEHEDDKRTSHDSCKKLSRKAHRLIGTPDYMAPEILKGISTDNFTIDWWSLGIMLFEFICGVPPFNDETVEKIYDNIENLRVPWDDLQIGYGEDCMSPEAADLIKKLLTLDHTQRLGANGAEEIKKHPFFKDFKWDTFRQGSAPIRPEMKSELDTDNFKRLEHKIDEKERQNPFAFLPKDKTSANNMERAKQTIEASAGDFHMLNYIALDKENERLIDETIKERDRELMNLESADANDENKWDDDDFDLSKTNGAK
jgi:serine/threonine protein kinase